MNPTQQHSDSTIASPLISVLLPVYNEVDSIDMVLKRVAHLPFKVEVVVIDDGSNDGTEKKLQRAAKHGQIRLIRHDKNQGKGAAVRRGFAEALGDIFVVQDADLEYDPADLASLLTPIIEDEADVTYGSRFATAGRGHMRRSRYLANKALTAFSNKFTKLALTDMETGYKALKKPVARQLIPLLQEDRFGIEPEITARIAQLPHVRLVEVPISYQPRGYADGKKIGFKDGLWALQCIWRCRKPLVDNASAAPQQMVDSPKDRAS